MRVLLTNDDGIFAKGIEALYLTLTTEHEVTVVAPETEQSAVGHAITMMDPLRVKPVNRNGSFFGYALSGTPGRLREAGGDRTPQAAAPRWWYPASTWAPTSGVNVIYSGTVSAATEGTLLGHPVDCGLA